MKISIFNEFPEEAKAVREEVFICEQGFSYHIDETDDAAVHFVMLDGNVPIGTCRIFESEKSGAYILGRLAVKKEYRRKGIGKKLVEAAKEYIIGIGGKILSLHSQFQAKEFYLKLGFEEYGEIEYEDGCPHIWMKKEL